MIARVKISQNVDILAKVYLVYLKVELCQTLHVVSTFTGIYSTFTGMSRLVIVEGGQNVTVKTSQNCPCAHIWVNSQNRQLTGFDHYNYLPLKFSCSRRVKEHILCNYVFLPHGLWYFFPFSLQQRQLPDQY